MDLGRLAVELVDAARLVAPRRPVEDRVPQLPAPVRQLGRLVPFLLAGLFIWARCFSGLYDGAPDTAVIQYVVTSETSWREPATQAGERECEQGGYRQVRVDVAEESDPSKEFPNLAKQHPEMLPTVPEGASFYRVIDRIIIEC